MKCKHLLSGQNLHDTNYPQDVFFLMPLSTYNYYVVMFPNFQIEVLICSYIFNTHLTNYEMLHVFRNVTQPFFFHVQYHTW